MVEEQLSASDGFVSAKDGKLKSEDYAHALKVNFRGVTIHCFASAIIAVRLSLYVLVTLGLNIIIIAPEQIRQDMITSVPFRRGINHTAESLYETRRRQKNELAN